MNLDGICKLEFRSSERRVEIRYALGYKHFTPRGGKLGHVTWPSR